MRGSIFKQKCKDGSISYGVIYDDHPEPGRKRKQKRIRGFRTRKDADDKLTEIRAAVQKCGRYYEPTKLTVTEYVEKWLAEVAHCVRPRTAVGYGERLRDYVVPRLGRMPMWGVQPQHMKDLYAELLQEGRKRKGNGADKRHGLRPRSVLHVHRISHAMFAEAVRTQVIPTNPCSSVKPPRVQPIEQRVLSENEVGNLIRAAQGTRFFLFVVSALATGARIGELLALKWRYVNLEDGRITVAFGQAKDGTVTEPKTRRSRRSIALPLAATVALRAHKARQKLSRGEAWSENEFVFQDDFGGPWIVHRVGKQFREIVVKAGLGLDVHPHTLRHTYASLALKGGVPVTTVSANLGHSSTATTMNVYAHHIPSAEDAAATVMQRALEGA